MATSNSIKFDKYDRLIGEGPSRTKLAEQEVRLVLALLAEGMSQRKVAAKMGIGRTTVSGILMRKKRAELAAEDATVVRRLWREGYGWRIL